MSENSIKDYSKEVNMTIEQAKKMKWVEIIKFIIIGGAKLVAFGAFLWILRHI